MGGQGSRRRRGRAGEFDFKQLNLTAIWARLELTATQLSRLTGISRRQVEWWRRRGYLTPAPQAPDRFNGDAVTLALLMKQALDAGVPLARAHDLATRHLARLLAAGVEQTGAGAPGESPDQTAMVDLEQKLLAAYNTIGLVLKSVSPLAQRVESEFELDSGPSQSVHQTAGA